MLKLVLWLCISDYYLHMTYIKICVIIILSYLSREVIKIPKADGCYFGSSGSLPAFWQEVCLMKKVERYFYPAVFTYEPGQEIAVVFPDLDCATSWFNDDDALLSARELLGCVMNGLEEDGDEIPEPTPLSQVKIEETERAVLVDVYMPSVRMAQMNKSVARFS